MPNTVSREDLLNDIRAALTGGANPESAMEAALGKILAAFQCPVGTVHILDAASGMLLLRAKRGIPDMILDKVKAIPVGKGMAGIAAERRQPVQVCNLQTDASGVAKPGAKDTKMEGSITVPMFVNDVLRGTLGVAKPVPYEFDEAECGILMDAGALIASLTK